MNLSQLPPATAAFATASSHYASAVQTLQSPLELPFAVLADQAKGDVAKAVELLTPFSAGGDMFTSRNAASSIANAKEAIAMIDQLGNPAADSAVTIDQVVSKLQHAEQVLWYEGLGG